MQNDFRAEEKLQQKEELKKRHVSAHYSVGGAKQKTELCTLVSFLNTVSWLSVNENLTGAQLEYIWKIKDRKHV